MPNRRNGSILARLIRPPRIPRECRCWLRAGASTPHPSGRAWRERRRGLQANSRVRGSVRLRLYKLRKEFMPLELVIEEYPKHIKLKDGFQCELRPLETADEIAFHEFFLAVPTQE